MGWIIGFLKAHTAKGVIAAVLILIGLALAGVPFTEWGGVLELFTPTTSQPATG